MQANWKNCTHVLRTTIRCACDRQVDDVWALWSLQQLLLPGGGSTPLRPDAWSLCRRVAALLRLRVSAVCCQPLAIPLYASSRRRSTHAMERGEMKQT